MPGPIYRILALCARIDCDAALYRQIAQAAAQVIEWEAVPIHAEAHGVAPPLNHDK